MKKLLLLSTLAMGCIIGLSATKKTFSTAKIMNSGTEKKTVKVVLIYQVNNEITPKVKKENRQHAFYAQVHVLEGDKMLSQKEIHLAEIAPKTQFVREIRVYSDKAKFGDNWFERKLVPANWTKVGPVNSSDPVKIPEALFKKLGNTKLELTEPYKVFDGSFHVNEYVETSEKAKVFKIVNTDDPARCEIKETTD